VSTRTGTSAHTRTQTATFLTEVIMGAIADMLADLGIDLTRFYAEWGLDEAAIAAWIEEGSLKQVVLECHRPDGTVNPVFEFPLEYHATGVGDARFVSSRAALARYRAKLGRTPPGTAFRLFCTYSGPHSAQPGWGPGRRASTDGLRSTSLGTLAEGPHGRASARYFT
jgi:hypothetical protein